MENSTKVQLGPIMPIGGIIIWSGDSTNFDDTGKGTGSMQGWAICNGQNGSPDLRDQFIVGAGNKYALNQQGGNASVTLTPQQIPSHSHSYYITQGNNTLGWGYKGSTDYSFGNVASTTGNSGGGEPFDNRPPFFALLYIMKIS